jgi:thiamine pyrophosphokinase
VPEGAIVVAADSGLYLAERLGVPVAVAVGDFDSVDAETLERFAASGTAIDRHHPAKDRTDLEIALEHARALGAERVIVLAGGGGRMDHLIGNALLLGAAPFAGMAIEAYFGPACLKIVRNQTDLRGEIGEIVALLALHGPVHGIVTHGLLYPLQGESLVPGSTRGLSNELVASRASVQVGEGTLLVLQPGYRGVHVAQGLGGAGRSPAGS